MKYIYCSGKQVEILLLCLYQYRDANSNDLSAVRNAESIHDEGNIKFYELYIRR
jgi:hypothetical protein